MSNDDTTPPPQSSPKARRSSFAGQTFADLFGTGRPSVSRPSQDGSSGSPPSSGQMGPITAAATQAHQRRLSLTTLGLGGSPNQTSPFSSFRGGGRRESFSSANSGSIDESAIEDDNGGAGPARDPSTGGSGSPFARRMSFGAQALRDVRNSKSGANANAGAGGGGGGGPQNGRSPPPTTIAEEGSSPYQTPTAQRNRAISSRSDQGRGLSSLRTLPHSVTAERDVSCPLSCQLMDVWRAQSQSQPEESSPSSLFAACARKRTMLTKSCIAEGFNWSDNLRSRAERTSIAGPPSGGTPGFGGFQNRSKSIATMEEQPVREMPKPQQKRPDHFQERILKGDFYMD